METDFEFLETDDAQHTWRYPELTQHVRHISALLKQTVEHEMAGEAHLLRLHDTARGAIKSIVEMPDQDADALIRSLRENNWNVSNKLRKTFPAMFEADGAFYAAREQLLAAVRNSFAQNGDQEHVSR